MLRKTILLFGLTALLLAGCAQAPAPTTAPETTLETTPPDIVYAKAQTDYLLPLESYSSQREAQPEFVMIHFTSAVVLNSKDPYNMALVRSTFADNQVSTHYIIDRAGNISCYIPENRVAWHAGKGTWQSDETYTNRMNHYAIGIELAAIGSQTDMKQYLTAAQYKALDPSFIGYTDAQYEALQGLVSDICARYAIPADRQHIIGHQEYAPKKSDPGQLFDWVRLIDRLNKK